ncbi:MAG: serine/threonine protein kinase [Deltaproteobacteria bacterium]|nr:MAG: serine/threonine protein kinase [Deltaproteobacteria bacterium]
MTEVEVFFCHLIEMRIQPSKGENLSQYVWGNKETQFFYQLDPLKILDSIDELGLKTTGRSLALNSMENRVYEVEISDPLNEGNSPSDYFVIAKYYRPGRWSKEQILEEHLFLKDLTNHEIPAIAPLEFGGETLFTEKDTGIYYCLFPKQGGRNPDEYNDDQLEQLGRLLGRIHSVGKARKANNRIALTPDTFGRQNVAFLRDNGFLPTEIKDLYLKTSDEIFEMIQPLFDNLHTQRIHGDCHAGNVLWHPTHGYYFIDLDDMLTGPAVQDVWLLLPGTDAKSIADRALLLEAYESMNDFNWAELKLIEPLRTLRYIHFSAWIAKRWEDPSFKQAFPHFDSADYWNVSVRDLLDQKEAIQKLFEPQIPDY